MSSLALASYLKSYIIGAKRASDLRIDPWTTTSHHLTLESPPS